MKRTADIKGVLFILVLGGFITIISIGSYYFFKKSGSAERRLSNLLRLSSETSSKLIEENLDWRKIAKKAETQTREAESYCSVAIMKDLTIKELRNNDYVVAKWRIDFVKPDKHFISQEAWDNELGILYDQWISIGDTSYQNAGLWAQMEDKRNEDINKSFLVENMLLVLGNETPISFQMYSYKNKKYLLLEYTSSIFSEKIQGYIKDCYQTCRMLERLKCELFFWIDIESGFLVKGEVNGKTKTENSINAQQVFTCFNEDIKINPPPWLNIEKNAEGESVIVNTQVPIVHHHP